MTTQTRETTLTFDEMLARMFPEPNGLVRLVLNAFTTHEYFFRYGHGRWHWPPGATHPDTPEGVLARTERDVEVRVSALLYAAPSPGAPVTLPFLWCAFNVGLGPSVGGLGYPIDPVSARAAAATVGTLNPAPTLVLDEGVRLVALWRLAQPFTDLGAAERVLTALAVKHGGDRRATDPRREGFAVPGRPHVGVFPTHHVRASVVSGRDVRVEDFGL